MSISSKRRCTDQTEKRTPMSDSKPTRRSPYRRFPLRIRVTDGDYTQEYWVDTSIPEGMEWAVYEEGWGPTDECLEYCERCTDAWSPGSTRDNCMNSDAGALTIQVTRADFIQ
jgi:hypothetical protein